MPVRQRHLQRTIVSVIVRPEAEPEPRGRTRLQLGVSLKSTLTPGTDTNNSLDPTFVWRWRGKGSRADDRWAPAYRLSSFSTSANGVLSTRRLNADALIMKAGIVYGIF